MEENINYQKLAYQDLMDFLSGKIQDTYFIQKYKFNVAKSYDYGAAVLDVLRYSERIYDAEFAKSVDMQESDFEPLRRGGYNVYAPRIVSALFAVAYTRKPSNRLGGDGKPESYDCQRNLGVAALWALRTLQWVSMYPVVNDALYNEYSFPRKMSDAKKVSGAIDKNVVSRLQEDIKLTEAENIRLASQAREM